mmetsp:Transcript_60321/g.127737  ORF Transcript_60321/g.127737 Transcript_60321/m.127737 type:complete len:273 (+) Transcript_60321:455-1273(+)
MLQQHGLAGMHLVLSEDASAGKEFDVLRIREPANGIDAAVNAPDAALDSLLRPVGIVTVAVEDALEVGLEHLLGHSGSAPSHFDLGGNFAELVGHHSSQYCVDQGDVLAGAASTELESVAAEWEGRGAVTVLGRGGDLRKLLDAEVDLLRLRLILRRLAVEEALHVLRHLLSEVRGNHRWGSLHRTKSEVVARAGDGSTHEVTELVHSSNRGGHDDGEDLRLACELHDIGRVEQVVLFAIGHDGQRPVVVLAASVDTLEGLLGEEGGQAMLD